ncbi:MAG: c-type cytochrome [gamma proteobacterium symbiont of Bathyaustriella thionipta]|nr:c-type cytochrome [gamma proteobacterium symbiont of Bathyaustriella thionipta]MCU7950803.1 c-type cytochrome [gamma proteobacterium symbiont of Bathyaustriella thionipta]MCU7952352.1 c-type cytochrome [gamma proteobacterium symbiont of Bathyaustriella thionipta]MCU7957315.1 c-type cytochrome [gamma proteobacterium symbiont of Bathyaustriella thionipta]MCU7966422.1 c-type cytochrome [gamma proteobacterium symbiont of Bathyaustriella thionipta]
MKLNKKVLGLIVLGGLAVSGNSWSGTASALDLANTCAGCHGVDGSSVGPATPSLAGISSEYFTETMASYKDPEGRYSTIMSRIAKGYTDEEINLMAGYFSKQKMIPAAQDFDAKQAKAGAKLHKKYCEKCHEDGGRSSEDDAGILAGQWMEYMQFTMDDFTNGRRDMPKKMKKKVQKLEKAKGAAGMTQLMHFYGSQK